MSGEIFVIKPGGGGGGTGGTLTVTGVAGHTVTATNGSKTYTRTLTSSGTATFKGLATGTWTLEMSGGGQTASSTVAITVDYSVTMKYFAATINVTYPAGSTCSISNGTTTLTAPNTSGTWAAVVPSAGTWTVNCTDGSSTASQAVSITADGQSESVTLSYATYYFTNGDQCTAITGGWTQSNSKPSEATSAEIWAYRYNYDDGTSYANCYTNSKVDLTNIEKIYVTFKGTPSRISFGVGTTTTNRSAASITAVSGLNTLNVSTLSGSYYISFGGSGTKGTTISGGVTECYGV